MEDLHLQHVFVDEKLSCSEKVILVFLCRPKAQSDGKKAESARQHLCMNRVKLGRLPRRRASELAAVLAR